MKTILNYIDRQLNVVTMYRLTLYCLLGLLVSAMVAGYFGLIPYSPLALAVSATYIGFFCWLTNFIFSRVFGVPANVESLYITALILVFIITPLQSFSDNAFYSLAAWASVLAMSSKYILAVRKKHLFNPAAVAVVITSLVLGLSASWWIGTSWMIVPTLVAGFLITRKIIHTELVYSFLLVSVITVLVTHNLTLVAITTTLEKFLFTSATFFFATVMLTEPLTAPPTKMLRIIYAALVGLLFVPTVHIGSWYSTPELALVIGNLFSYFVSPKEKLMLRLAERKKVGANTFDLVFQLDRQLNFRAGQYMEWTLPARHSDQRGNRRFFTLASSPTETTVRLGVKSYENMSTFKRDLLRLQPGETIVAAERAGDFVLPRDKKRKLVFIAGGIGITPFRSMLKYLVDKKEKRDIVLFYSNNVLDEVVYTDIFDVAYKTLGIRTIYTLTNEQSVPAGWLGEKGFVDAAMIRKYVPDIGDKFFYISGPHSMVSAFERTLSDMRVKGSHIKTDFFPGFV